MENKVNAQDIIDDARIEEDNLKFFYPEIHKQQKADENLTKCLRELT